MMSRLGGPKGVIRQTEFFLYSQSDREAVEACRSLGLSLSRDHRLDPRRRGGRPPGQGDGPQGDGHPHLVLRLSHLPQAGVDTQAGHGRCISAWCGPSSRPGSSPAAISRTSPGRTSTASCIPFAIELMKLREESGIDIKIRLCDTMGYGVTYPGAALPRSVHKLVRAFIDDAGGPRAPARVARPQRLPQGPDQRRDRLALRLQRRQRHACSAIGERTGNPPLEGLIIEYIGLRATLTGSTRP